MLLRLIVLLFFTQAAAKKSSDYLKIYWNSPTARCLSKFNVSIPIETYSIVGNKNQEFVGEKISTFYEYNIGVWPHFDKYNASQPVNGGLPQLADLTQHLALVAARIQEVFPDPDFDGPAIFDVEEWRPTYVLNWGVKKVYREESVKLAKKRNPSLTDKQAIAYGAYEFDEAARAMLVETLRLARRLRPRAKWGYYGFPYCNYDAGQNAESTCSQQFQKHNDQMNWLYVEQTGLFPSIYISGGAQPDLNMLYIHAILAETKRMQRANLVSKLPIYAYTKIEYNPYNPTAAFYNKRDLCNSLRQLTDIGAEGALLWSTDKDLDAARCGRIAENLGKISGPYMDAVRSRAQFCADNHCSGRGKCVRIAEPLNCDLELDVSDHACECDDGWAGPRCDLNRSNLLDLQRG
ncbi:chhy-1 [Pristionchus pacificus]|uniref:Hyaluronidase n=1 Tax=Pristionchus pacificus TaxID=54126 RepID=A0A2A6BVR0_PRIPA|nr:chhy-1 [Pristionchus pacificus]|eukprot:PDM69916.1 glycoside hydrolase [Pristionchus pacificus]